MLSDKLKISRLQDFANEIIDSACEGAILDGADIQEIAVSHGLLIPEMRYKNCSTEDTHCSCSEICSSSEFEQGVECYQKTEVLK